MRKLIFGGGFLRCAKNLENQFKPKLDFCLSILQKDLFDERLHVKTLKGRDYRVIFQVKSDKILLIEIGHRKDIYQ